MNYSIKNNKKTDNQTTAGIYEIRNKLNGKVYIGSSIDVNHRWYRHKNKLRKNKHGNIHLQRSWNKNGEESFTFNLLEIVIDNENLIKKEQFWIDYNKSFKSQKGYNICRNAGNTLGRLHTSKSKKLIGKRSVERNAVKSIYGMSVKGEEHPNAKLSNKEVMEIKYMLKETDLALETIAGFYGLLKGSIWSINEGITWAHIKLQNDFELSEETKEMIEPYKEKAVVRLTEQEIKDIRIISRDTNMSRKKVAEMFGVKEHRIKDIRAFRTHKHITIDKDDEYVFKEE